MQIGGDNSRVGVFARGRAGMKNARELPADAMIVVSLSGRGDKDMNSVTEYLNR